MAPTDGWSDPAPEDDRVRLPWCSLHRLSEDDAIARDLRHHALVFARQIATATPMRQEPPLDQMTRALDPAKFQDPFVTAEGETRATVALKALETLWFNTGTLCNLTCQNCYIESSPRNDRLAWLSLADILSYLDEIARDALPTR